uniref:Uncharacterized protein n=1 Tax=Rhizophora mucronata TaxID=61149 RepID=A0A2P2PTY2_RHIMU
MARKYRIKLCNRLIGKSFLVQNVRCDLTNSLLLCNSHD